MGTMDVAHPDLVNGAVTALHSHAGGGGLTHYYAESPGSSETSSTSWQEKLSYEVVEAGDYLVQWTFELSASATTAHCRGQVLHNSTELANPQYEPEDISPDCWISCAGFRKLTLAQDDVIAINYCSETSALTTGIRYAAISLLKL
jgi:hypothetical protein